MRESRHDPGLHSLTHTTGRFSHAVFFILTAIFLFDVQGALIKFLGDRYPVQVLSVYRNLFGLLPCFVLLWLSRDWHAGGRRLSLGQWKLGFLRGFFVAGAQLCFYYSLTKLAFATATTLAFIGPVFVTLLSIPLLRHHVGVWRWSAVGLGFLGVMFIMRPGSEVFSLYAILPICASFGYSLAIVTVRLFEPGVSTALIHLYATLGALLGSLLILFVSGHGLGVNQGIDWLWLIAMGTVGGLAVLAMVHAYRLTAPANLSPFEYFGIPFSFTLGWLFFDETPFETLLPGVFFVVGGGLLIAWRERPQRQ